jgi:hypothetical protein
LLAQRSWRKDSCVIVKIEKPELAGLQAIEATARAFADAVEGAGGCTRHCPTA